MDTKRGDSAGAAPAASLIEISRVLEETARIVRAHAEGRRASTHGPIGAQDVRAILAARALRRRHLGLDLSDAAWAMVLELYASKLEGRLVYQTRLGVDAGVPQTTALNTVRRLLELGLFVSGAHPDDKRLIVLTLSHEAADGVAAWLEAARALTPLPC